MKKLLAMLLALCLVLGAAACGNKETPAETKGSATTEGTDAQDDDETESVDDEEDDGEIAEINVVFWSLSNVPTDMDKVSAAISAITEEKINTKVNLNILEMGNYIQQVNLMMSSNEKVDLMVTLPGGPPSFNAMTSQNQLQDITELLEKYGQDILATVPEDLQAGTMIDGKYYAMTSYGDKASPLSFVCRTDILEKTGIDPSTIKTAADLETLLLKVKEVEPTMVPLTSGSKKILTAPYLINENNEFVMFDGIGEADLSILAVREGSTTVENFYETPEWDYTVNLFADWYDKGLVDKDISTREDGAESVVLGGLAFGFLKCQGVGTEAAISATCGYDMTVIELADAQITTGGARKFTWAVPVTATEPEAAVKFMNLIFTDEEVLNLLTWGIEGEHYQTLADGSIDFLDGQDANSCAYFLGDATSILGNGYLAKVRSGQDLDLRETIKKVNEESAVSEFMGFGFATTDLENQVTALTNVFFELGPSLKSGLGNDEINATFKQQLKDAGVDEYIAAAQEQLDAWLANQ